MATKLEEFGLTWDPTATNYNWWEGRTAADAWDLLRMRRETLREVKLSVCHVPEIEEEDWGVGRLELRSSADFERLELLNVGDLCAGGAEAGVAEGEQGGTRAWAGSW
jgi:hypothetical protein